MSTLPTSQGLEYFEQSLRLITADIAEQLGFGLSLEISSNMVFFQLIRQCSRKYGSNVAVLIDEYDAPVTALLDEPDKADEVRKVLLESPS
jgi:hypothetical protein